MREGTLLSAGVVFVVVEVLPFCWCSACGWGWAGAYLSAGVVFVVGKFLVHGFEEHLVGDFPHVHTGLVQDGENSLVRRLHQLTDDLVVEVINLQYLTMLHLLYT